MEGRSSEGKLCVWRISDCIELYGYWLCCVCGVVGRGVLSKTRLTHLAAQIDPKQVLDEDVQDVSVHSVHTSQSLYDQLRVILL